MPTQLRGERHDGHCGLDHHLHPARRRPAPDRRAAAAPTADLKQKWRELFGKEPPAFGRSPSRAGWPHRIRKWLPADCAPRPWRGWRRSARSSTAAISPFVGYARTIDRSLAPGWCGSIRASEHVVTVLADGFESEGQPSRSLSAIARHITGTRWNGWTFFGLRGRGVA